MLKNVTMLLLAVTTATVATAQTAATPEDKEKKAELVDQLFSERSYLYAQMVDKLFTLNISPSCWVEFDKVRSNENTMGTNAVSYWVRNTVEYAKHEGLGDLMSLAVDNKEVEKANRPMIDDMIKEIGKKFSMTVNAPVECKGMAYELMTRYPYQVMQRIGPGGPEWGPTGGEAHFTITLDPKATDMAVKISPDGKKFAVSGPAYTEAYDTQGKIEKGLQRANKNR